MVSKELKEKIALAYRVCRNCGIKYGNGVTKFLATWVVDETCDVCEEKTEITDFSNYGFARNEFVETN